MAYGRVPFSDPLGDPLEGDNDSTFPVPIVKLEENPQFFPYNPYHQHHHLPGGQQHYYTPPSSSAVNLLPDFHCGPEPYLSAGYQHGGWSHSHGLGNEEGYGQNIQRSQPTTIERGLGSKRTRFQDHQQSVKRTAPREEQNVYSKRRRHAEPEVEDDDEFQDYPVIVESIEEEANKATAKRFQINMGTHCIFCLRRTTKQRDKLSMPKSEMELLEVVPVAKLSSCSSSAVLSTFNFIWQMVHNQNNKSSKEGDHDDDEEIIEFLKSLQRNSTGNCTTFTNVPKLCRICGDKFHSIDKLLMELKGAVGRLGDVFDDSKYGGKFSWRAENFEKAMKRSTMDKESFRATIDLLNGLGKGTLIEYDPGNNLTTLRPLSTSETDFMPMPCSHTDEIHSATSSRSQPSIIIEPSIRESTKGIEASSSSSKVRTIILTDETDESMDVQEGEAVSEEDDESDDDNEKDPDYIKSEQPEYESESDPDDIKSEQSEYESGADSGSNFDSDDDDDDYSDSGPVRKKPVSKIKPTKRTKIIPQTPTPTEIPKLQESKVSIGYDFELKKHVYKCLINDCGWTCYTKSGDLLHHQKMEHNQGNIVPCDLCGKLLAKKHIPKHKRRAHPNNQVDLAVVPGQKCDLCKEHIPMGNILEHARTHLGTIGEEYLIKCPNPDCPFVFFQSYTLTRHLGFKKTPCKKFKSDLDIDKATKVTRICEVCGVAETTALKLRAHINVHHENSTKNFACPIEGCQQQFTFQQSVLLHLPMHDIRKGFDNQFCNECKTKIRSTKMEEHLKEVHQALQIIKCPHCPFIFSSREFLIDHFWEHRYKILACDICNDEVRYQRHNSLRDHYFQAHQIGTKLQCDQCSKTFWTHFNLRSHHQRFHDPNNLRIPKTFKCDECDAEFKVEKSVRSHKMRVHGAAPLACKYCSATFVNDLHLLKHEQEHKGTLPTEPLQFKCEIKGCDRVFSQKKLLKRHISFNHLGERPHVCDKCGKSYPEASALREHINVNHLGLRPYICEICSESFGTASVLRKHNMIHTGERPYACEICGQRFRYREVLKRHVDAHERKGSNFKPNGPMKQVRKRVEKDKLSLD